MEMIALPVLGESDIGHVRRTTQVLAAGLGFDPTGVAELAIAATELATNLVSHAAVEGVITLAAFGDTPSPGIEIVSNDRGPGIADIDLAFSDRTSTRADSMGSGLGAVRRMVDRLDVYSSVGGNGEDGPQGTIIAARKWVDSPPTAAPFDYAMWTRAVSGQTVNGDGAARNRDAAERVRAKMFTLGLKGASENLRDLFFSNMSERAGKILREDMEAMGPVRLSDVDDAQTQMIAKAKDLAASGEIVIDQGGGEDELVY